MQSIVATSTVALLVSQVSAHGYLSQPAAEFPNGIETMYNDLMTETCDPAFAGLKWNDSPEANTAMFTKSFPNSQYKTLKDMMDTVVTDCGKTILTGSPIDVSSLSSMKWQNDQEHAGFIDSHHGPCEGWIDDKRVFHSDDCRADFPAYPAEIPVDFSSCTDDSTFTFYWLAVHEPNWQVYKQCVPITKGSGGATQTEVSDDPVTVSSNVETFSPTIASPADAPPADASNSTGDSSSTGDSTPTSIEGTSTGDGASGNATASTTTEFEAETAVPTNSTLSPIKSDATVPPTVSCKTRRRPSSRLRAEN